MSYNHCIVYYSPMVIYMCLKTDITSVLITAGDLVFIRLFRHTKTRHSALVDVFNDRGWV